MSEHRKIRPSFFLAIVVAAAAIAGTVVIACDDTGPSPIGVHFDDASVEPDTAPPPDEDAGEEAGEEAGDDAGEDAAEEAGEDAAADARDD